MIKEGKADKLPLLYTHAELPDESDAWKQLALDEVKTEFVAVRFGNVLAATAP